MLASFLFILKQAAEAYMLHGEYIVLLADQSPGKIVV